MSLILNIDTAIDIASVCLAQNEETIELVINENPKNHTAWLHQAIDKILKKNNFKANRLDAVAVSIGPGSYTGLRVGLSAAKGFCYALNIPLITVNTLELIAYAVKDEATDLICPVIDARRMEVFTAVYDKSMRGKISPQAMIVDGNSFSDLLSSHTILFCSNGSQKLQSLIKSPRAVFSGTRSNAAHLAILSGNCFRNNQFSDLAYTEPLYIKEFYSPTARTD